MRPRAGVHAYDPADVEPRWQQAWRDRHAFRTPPPRADHDDVYVLVSCPFTSGAAHMGHVRSYAIGDAYARFRRARGDAVLFSLGFDAFGLPAELGAIEHGVSPGAWVERCAARMREQFDRLGFSFDWDREFVSSDPDIYQWTQWLFVVLHDMGLVYERDASVDWCDGCRTVLSRLQARDGTCWRCHGPVRLVRATQWFLRAAAYARENHDNLARLARWNKAAIGGQRAAIGRVDGVELEVRDGTGNALTVFTPYETAIGRGAFVLISPNHPEIDTWAADHGVRAAIAGMRDGGWERADRGLTQLSVVSTGRTVSVKGSAERLPVVVSTSVDARFGVTASLGVPELDTTDAAIAELLSKIPDPSDRRAGDQTAGDQQAGDHQAKDDQVDHDPRTTGPVRTASRFRAGDFPISRQRAWGAPVPIVRCDSCGPVPVPLEQLPVRLPVDLLITSERNALEGRRDFVETPCPTCRAPARRDTDTLDCHFDATVQQFPLAVPAEDRARSLFDHAELRRWLPVGFYIQGSDTANFVLDQRTVTKALRDFGVLDFLADGEPYGPTFTHEMVQLDGRKMSKHLGNVVDPQDVVERFGADVLRFAVLHAAAPSKSVAWDESHLERSATFLRGLTSYAVPRLAKSMDPHCEQLDPQQSAHRRLATWCNAAITHVTTELGRLEMHRVTRNLVRLSTQIQHFEAAAVQRDGELGPADRDAVLAALLVLVRLLAPVTPHLAEELWRVSGREPFVADAGWPEEMIT